MKCCYISVALLVFLNIHLVSNKFNLNRLAVTVGRMKDKDVRIENVNDYMQCINKCFLRNTCVVMLFELFTEDIFTQTDYKCSLSKKTKNLTNVHKKTDKCPNRVDPIIIYPRAIAGACSDHECVEGQKCHPRKSGGYTCDRERGSKQKKKKKKVE